MSIAESPENIEEMSKPPNRWELHKFVKDKTGKKFAQVFNLASERELKHLFEKVLSTIVNLEDLPKLGITIDCIRIAEGSIFVPRVIPKFRGGIYG